MDHLFEARVRRLVAESLGVGFDDLSPEVSLTDDLAVDSLDLLDLALVLEEEFGLTVPERTIGEVRTYGNLVAATVTLARNRAEARPAVEPVRVWVRVVAPGGFGGVLERFPLD
jgi:acyl carrier protein